MIQKSDGGFGYASTDMACIRYRANELKADRLVYVTDVSQELHFKNIFLAAEKVGYVDPKKVKLDHMMFGMAPQENITVDEDGKEVKKAEKIKTREGKSVKLIELLDEARDRALATFKERIGKTEEVNEEEEKDGTQAVPKVQIEGEDELKKAAEVLGLSSVKYFDLKQNRTQNYVFSFDQMLDPKGNTGVYLIYSYVRICSILRKAEFELVSIPQENADY